MFTRARDFEVVVAMSINTALVTCPRSNAILLALNDLKEIWTYAHQFGFQARVLNGCKDPLPSTGLQVPLLSGTTLLTRTITVPTGPKASGFACTSTAHMPYEATARRQAHLLHQLARDKAEPFD
jgi:hypothetical protein